MDLAEESGTHTPTRTIFNFTFPAQYCTKYLKNNSPEARHRLILRETHRISLWTPGRLTRKVTKTALVSALILLTVMGSIGPQIPALLSVFFPNTGTPPSLSQTNHSVNSSPNLGPGSPLAPGPVQYGYRATPTVNQPLNNSVPPHLAATGDAYIYQTSYGIYSFNRSLPFIFSVRSSSGTPLTAASFFFVTAPPWSLFPGSSTVTQATDTQFRVSYEVRSGNIVVGHLLLQANFLASKPKFSISFSKTSSWN
jgi:hypothetical protein